MLKIFTASTKQERILLIVLLSITGALILLLLTGTIFGLARSSDTPLFRLGRTAQTAPAALDMENDDIRIFSGLGRLRITLSNSSVLILTIAFPYSASDIAFTEELAAKINEFRTIASDYFASLSAEKLIFLDEETAKTEILRKYNTALRLGRIEALYFTDLMIIDAN